MVKTCGSFTDVKKPEHALKLFVRFALAKEMCIRDRLLTPDEVRMLDNQYAILFIRGERPIMDFKYDIMKHPNVALTTDGKASPYKHGEVCLLYTSKRNQE